MAYRIVDASALLAFLRDDPGADLLQSAFELATKKGTSLLMTDISLAEVKRSIFTTDGSAWKKVKGAIASLPLEFVSSTVELAEIAGCEENAESINLEVAFSIALTRMKKGELITAHPLAKDTGVKVTQLS